MSAGSTRFAASTTLLAGVAIASLAMPADASVVLSNLASYTGSGTTHFFAPTVQGATMFTTGSGPWTVSTVSMRGFLSIPGTIAIWSSATPASGPHSDVPGTLVATSAAATAGPSTGEINFDFTGGSPVTLSGGTKYWLVFGTGGGSMGFRQTTTAATAQAGSGWSGTATSLTWNTSTQASWDVSTQNNYSFFYSIGVTASAVPGGGGIATIALAASGVRRRRR